MYVCLLCVTSYSQFKTAEEVLRGACHMVAMQIAHEPLLKQTVRALFYERAKITAAATKKGMKVGCGACVWDDLGCVGVSFRTGRTHVPGSRCCRLCSLCGD